MAISGKSREHYPGITGPNSIKVTGKRQSRHFSGDQGWVPEGQMRAGKPRIEVAGTQARLSLMEPGTCIHLARLWNGVTQTTGDTSPLTPCVEQLSALLKQSEGEGGLRRGEICGGGNLHEVL